MQKKAAVPLRERGGIETNCLKSNLWSSLTID